MAIKKGTQSAMWETAQAEATLLRADGKVIATSTATIMISPLKRPEAPKKD